MASLDLMPNAVYTFLEIVDQGLWDGCSLVMKATHVLKAIPLPYNQTQDPAITANIFVDKNLNGPISKEYSHAFPHTPYSHSWLHWCQHPKLLHQHRRHHCWYSRWRLYLREGRGQLWYPGTRRRGSQGKRFGYVTTSASSLPKSLYHNRTLREPCFTNSKQAGL